MTYEVLPTARSPLPASTTGQDYFDDEPASFGQHAAEAVANRVGSWTFILIQSSIIAIWIALNTVGPMAHWDPYPFILLNLTLSLQAAYTAPMILMSQNRQAEKDRKVLYGDFALDHSTNEYLRSVNDRLGIVEAQMQALLDAVGASVQNTPTEPDAIDVTFED